MNKDQIKIKHDESDAKRAKIEENVVVYGDDSVFIHDPTETNISIDSIVDSLKIEQFFKLVDKKLEPNYFLCIKINNDKIIEACAKAQKEILVKNPDLAKANVKTDTLHVTLLAFYLRDEEEIQLFNTKLEENRSLFQVVNNFELTFQGISTFRDQVVYVDLIKDDHFKNLITFQKNLVKVAQLMNIPLFEKKFTPHLTLMKLSKAKILLKKGIKKINKELYEHIEDSHFGIEPVLNIHMCSIREKESDSLFYKTYWKFELNKI
ncbi:A-kinase anchor 7 isoform [Brachionus plicatilis]|uniref:A-kinase anchor 7 isoform n=1 Tax=Brachionus plicatilis TaxID=10195 RepID=A0A3M7RDW6_BRAPC|nr:A-kinase anchor 7 isoform [Brachionus plicatilis]